MIIISLANNPFEQAMLEITKDSHLAYAKKIGAEYHNTVLESGLEIIAKNPKKRLLYVSPYVLITPHARDIRKHAADKGVVLFEESRFILDNSKYIDFLKQIVGEKTIVPGMKYYNTDVMLIHSSGLDIFHKPPIPIAENQKSFWLNYVLQRRNDIVSELPFRFNRTMSVERYVGESRFRSDFINYRGLADEMGEAHTQVTILQDIAQLSKGETYRANYLVEMSGGLGDVVESEPALRFLVEKLCPEENIVVVTRNPEFFSHLNVPIYRNENEVPERNLYLKLQNMGRVEEVFFHFIMPHDTHFADLAAQRMLKRTLPIAERSIKLSGSKKPQIDDAFPWKHTVVFHPGKGWESKTFPVSFWENAIRWVAARKYPFVVVGKKIDEKQGYVPIEPSFLESLSLSAGVPYLDLRDKLEMTELFWVLENSPILITNDSAPVHIAGAFDNWIGLIATCKHPDYILPYRCGSPYYKARNLERRKLYVENRLPPNYIDAATIDLAKTEDLLEAVPDEARIEAFLLETGIKPLGE